MVMAFYHFAHVFVQVFFRRIAVLGASLAGLIAQIATIIVYEVNGGWWQIVYLEKTNWKGA